MLICSTIERKLIKNYCLVWGTKGFEIPGEEARDTGIGGGGGGGGGGPKPT